MELKTLPLLDNFETTLSQEWNGQVGKMKVDDLPAITVDEAGKFVWGFSTYVIVNPDKKNFQLAEVDGYDRSEKTLNVVNIDLLKWLGVNYEPHHHNQKSIVRISNNFAFWKKFLDVLNSKADYGVGKISWDFFLDVAWNLKFKDQNNTEITLSDIAGKIWQDKKVSITWEDEAGFLKNKLGAWFKFVWGKVEVDLWSVNFSETSEENFSENSFVLNWNKKVKLFKKENLDFLSKNIWNIEAVAWENLKKWDLVYFYPDKSCQLDVNFQGKDITRGVYSNDTAVKTVTKIRIKDKNFKISKLAFQIAWDWCFVKIFSSYDFVNMNWSNLICQFENRNQAWNFWVDVDLLPDVDYFIEFRADFWVGTFSAPDELKNFMDFLDFRAVNRAGASYAVDNAVSFCRVQVKSTKTNQVFKNFSPLIWERRWKNTKDEVYFDAVVMADCIEWENVILKADGIIRKSEIHNLWNRNIWENFWWDYIRIWKYKSGISFSDFIWINS